MEARTIEAMVRGRKIDRDRTDPETRLEGTEVIGAARVLGARLTGVTLKPREDGRDAFDQSPPRHGYLAWFTATVSLSSRPGEYVKVNDIIVHQIDSGVKVNE